jgi:small-conductance mechanosensitive channel
MMEPLTRILITLLVVVALVFLATLARHLAGRFAERRGYARRRVLQVSGLIKVVAVLIALIALAWLWGFNGRGLMVFASSVLALTGVALFASWSILSNTTAGMFLFFSAPFRVGDRIRVLDGDNTVTGTIHDMGVVYVELKDDQGHLYTLPNNLIMQRTVIRLKPDREIPCDHKHCR